MKNRILFKKSLYTSELSCISKKMNLFKDTKWLSFGTYIMTVEGFSYEKGSQNYSPIMNTFDYKSEDFIVNATYKNESYFIENKELYNNVSIGDSIVVTIKYFYDKDSNLIHSDIHHYHPYPLSNN